MISKTASVCPLLVFISAAFATDPPPLRVPSGFEVVEAAGPELVKRPVFAAFDDAGRLYVIDSSGSNADERHESPADTIVCLEDTDGDGTFDRRNLFADKIVFGTGIVYYDGSIYLASPPSLWRLRDRDGDGACDERTELVSGMSYRGSCSDDFHGACLGPDGRIYFLPGRMEHQIRVPNSDGRLLRAAMGPWLMRCRPNGADVEFVSGAVGNPVEVDFLPSGDFFIQGTFWAKPAYGDGLRDALVHGVTGGEYSVRDREYHDRVRTGDFLPPLVPMSATAPSGLMTYRGNSLGEEYRHNLFGANFNTHTIERYVLQRVGATYRATAESFVTGTHADIHFTDVLEDADGSLLAVDTGGWFRKCCPTSQIAKPEVYGGIYRIRRPAAPAIDDPRGLRLDWRHCTAAQCAQRLADPRPAVRERATLALSQFGADAIPAVDQILAAPNRHSVEQRNAAVWSLCRMDFSSPISTLLCRALTDPHEDVRQAAAFSLGLHRDTAAITAMVTQLSRDPSPSVRRECATALGRIRDAKNAVPELLAQLRLAPDRFLEHSLIDALIAIDDPQATRRGLQAENEQTRLATLIALDQMPHGDLHVQEILPLLENANGPRRAALVTIMQKHPDWGADIGALLATWLHDSPLDSERQQTIVAAVTALIKNDAVLAMVERQVTNRQIDAAIRSLLLQCLVQGERRTLPPSWQETLAALMHERHGDLAELSLRIVERLSLRGLDGPLRDRIEDRAKRYTESERISALRALVATGQPISPAGYELLSRRIQSAPAPADRLAAWEILAVAMHDDEVLIGIAPRLRDISAVELPYLLRMFMRDCNDTVAMQFLAAAHESSLPLPADMLEKIVSHFSPALQGQAVQLLERTRSAAKEQRERLDVLAAEIAELRGDVVQGEELFFGKAQCALCHRIGGRGSQIGPDLSAIGAVRDQRDLLEAIVFPSASLARGYEPILVGLSDGRVLTGLRGSESADTVRLIQVQQDKPLEIDIPRPQIDSIELAQTSIMPQGLDGQLTRQELGNLITYLTTLRAASHSVSPAANADPGASPRESLLERAEDIAQARARREQAEQARWSPDIPPHRPIQVAGLHAYAQKSLAAGDTLDLRVSSTVPYQLKFVRLGVQPDNPATDVVLHSIPVATPCPQPIHPGSYVHIRQGLPAEQPLSGLTIECWVRPFRLQDWQGLVTQHDYPEGTGIGLFLRDDRVAFLTGGGSAFQLEMVHEGSISLTKTQQWYHIVGTWDGSRKQIYVNGEPALDVEFRGVVRAGKSPLRLAAYGEEGIATRFLDGDLAGCVIYDRALGAAEIKHRYSERGLQLPEPSAVIGCWDFAEERGDEVHDRGPQQRHGRIIQQATWMIGGPSFDGAQVSKYDPQYDPPADRNRGHGLRFASDDLFDCRWRTTHRYPLPLDAPSGIYVARFDFQLDGQPKRYDVTFNVRRPPQRAVPPVLVICSSNTWLAYNSTPFSQNHGPRRVIWDLAPMANGHPLAPTYCMYHNHRHGQPTYQLGLNVPWPSAGPEISYINSDYSHLLRIERFLHTWLEREGYAYDTILDHDLDRDPEIVKPYKTIIIAGHSEYWSGRAVTAVDDYLRAGGTAVVLSGNTMFWRVSYDETYTIMECRKLDPTIGGREFAPPGEMFHSGDGKRGSLMRFCGYPAWSIIGLECAGWGGGDFPQYTVERNDHFLFHSPHEVGLAIGQTFGVAPTGGGVVGHEYDVRLSTLLQHPEKLPPEVGSLTEPAGMVTLARAISDRGTLGYSAENGQQIPNADRTVAEMIYWERPQGGKVFHSGAIATAWGLGHDPHLSQLLKNVLDHFGVKTER